MRTSAHLRAAITGGPQQLRGSGPSGLWLSIVLLLGSVVMLPAQARAQAAEDRQVKAAYLYNFTKFVDWPAEAFRTADDPAIICAVGDDRTSEVLQQAVSGKKANGRRVEARYPRTAAEFRSCHILFIGFSDKGHISEILNGLRDTHVLTVGQTSQFIPLGGMINLVQNNGRIELEIDPDTASAAGLKISSRLLVVSRVTDNRTRGRGL